MILLGLLAADDITVTGVSDGQAAHGEVFTAGSSEVVVVSSVVVNTGLGKHSVILDLGLGERRAVAADDDELGSASAKGLQGLFVAEGPLSRLANKSKARVDVVTSFFLLF